MANWFQEWLASQAVKRFAKLVVEGIKIFLGKVGQDVWKTVKKRVQDAELTDLKGTAKAAWVYEKVKADLGTIEVKEKYIRWLIESGAILFS